MTLDINKLEAAAKAALAADFTDHCAVGNYLVQVNVHNILELIARLREAEKDAARLDWLVKNNTVVLECVVERRGFRSTETNAVRETWTEHEGWTVSNLPKDSEPFTTMREAIDEAIKESEK